MGFAQDSDVTKPIANSSWSSPSLRHLTAVHFSAMPELLNKAVLGVEKGG